MSAGPGLVSLAVPVSAGSDVVAALSVTAPAERFATRLDTLGSDLHGHPAADRAGLHAGLMT